MVHGSTLCAVLGPNLPDGLAVPCQPAGPCLVPNGFMKH